MVAENRNLSLESLLYQALYSIMKKDILWHQFCTSNFEGIGFVNSFHSILQKLFMSLGLGSDDQLEIEQVGEKLWGGERKVWNSNSKQAEYKLLHNEFHVEWMHWFEPELGEEALEKSSPGRSTGLGKAPPLHYPGFWNL